MTIQFAADTPLTKRIWEMAEPVCANCGVDCYMVEVAGETGKTEVRVYIDAIDGVDIKDCTKVSKQLSTALEIEDPIQGAYVLQVSSPGLDRPLRHLDDVKTVIGHEIHVETKQPINGRRRFTGPLIGVEDNNIILSIDDREYRIPAMSVRKANLRYSFK